MKKLKKNDITGLLFALPALFLFTVFIIYPMLKIFFGSLLDWNGITEGKFIAMDNFKELFKDKLFYQSLFNGVICGVVLTVCQLVIGSVLALTILDRNVRGRNILRKGYFIPVVLSITVVCQLWLAMYDPSNGLFNKFFEVFGVSYRQQWLSNMNLSALIAIIAVNAWQYTGYQFILIYAGAKSIPEHYFEAARIDGATKLQTHLKVTIPLLAETYKMCLMFTFLGGLNMFGHMQIMTNGGPGTTTYTLTYMMFREAFLTGRYGYGSTISVFIIVQCLIVILLINRFIARERITY